MARTTTGRQDTQALAIEGLEIQLTRKQVKNINLRIRRDGTICVSAPSRVPLSQIEDFVQSRKAWIEEAQARIARQQATREDSCSSGATVMVWGAPLVVEVIPSPAQGRWPTCSFETAGNRLIVRADERICQETDQARTARKRALDEWLTQALRDRIGQRLPYLESVVGKACTDWRIRSMRSRWGSCNVKTKVITLNAQLVHHDRRCLDYVLTHELCHLHEPSHNARFHALMDTFYPAWREVRAQLNGR